MNRQQTTGYFFAFGASLALASSFVFSLTGGIMTLLGVWLITWDRPTSH